MSFEKRLAGQAEAEEQAVEISWDQQMSQAEQAFEARSIAAQTIDKEALAATQEGLKEAAVRQMDEEEQAEGFAELNLDDLNKLLGQAYQTREAAFFARRDLLDKTLTAPKYKVSAQEFQSALGAFEATYRNEVCSNERIQRLEKWISKNDPYSAENLKKSE
ncbi:MAG: hypothetical protein C3F02_01365 [Parcubacteria group bacterium]|nr:MAG: hypothetical protein C3F02_01365 [Parcubacteria group bacterium]